MLIKFNEFLKEFKTHLQYHETLNPILWTDEKLNSSVRSALLKFAEIWAKMARIPQDIITDVILTGGNANFTFTEKSDLDVHLIIDRDLMAQGMKVSREFLDGYLADKKVLWTLGNNQISLLGFPAEPYAQDKNEAIPKGQGVYSLLHDKWIQNPVNMHYQFDKNILLMKKVKNLSNVIKHLILTGASEQEVKQFKNSITSVRKTSIASDGEFGFDNLVFKALRNRGDLDRLDRYIKRLKAQELSLDR